MSSICALKSAIYNSACPFLNSLHPFMVAMGFIGFVGGIFASIGDACERENIARQTNTTNFFKMKNVMQCITNIVTGTCYGYFFPLSVPIWILCNRNKTINA